LLLAAPLAAQDYNRVQIHGYGGFAAPLADLQQTWYPDGSGNLLCVSFGAGLTYWLDQNLGVRVDGAYVGSKVVSPESNASWTKLFVGGDIVLRALSEGGLAPFGYFGLGQARMSESGTARKANRVAGRFGAGLSFTRGSGLGFFGEAGLLVYDFDQTRFSFFDKVQTDLQLKAGITFGLN
jgi:hypothetical protein